MSFKATKGKSALGISYSFHGPGLPRYANSVHFLQFPCDWARECLAKDAQDKNDRIGDHAAETVVRLLHEAFEAGRQDAKREFRQLLGV